MLRIATRILCVLLVVLVSRERVGAENGGLAITYPPGWNMVGVPPGTDLSAAEAVSAYSSSGYVAAQGAKGGCEGDWAYFSTSTTVLLPGGTAGPEQTCSVRAGWNMLGNPFADTVHLPSGVQGYRWNPLADGYEALTMLPPGTSAWVYPSSAGSMTLKPTAGSSSKVVITFGGTPPASPYQAHVGDLVTLVLPAASAGGRPPYSASADSAFLQLEALGLTGAPSSPQPYYTWLAYAPGDATITVDPACRQATPPCGQPSAAIRIQILP